MSAVIGIIVIWYCRELKDQQDCLVKQVKMEIEDTLVFQDHLAHRDQL